MQRFSGKVLDSRPRHCEFEMFVIFRLEFFYQKAICSSFFFAVDHYLKKYTFYYVKFHLTLKISFLWLYGYSHEYNYASIFAICSNTK